MQRPPLQTRVDPVTHPSLCTGNPYSQDMRALVMFIGEHLEANDNPAVDHMIGILRLHHVYPCSQTQNRWERQNNVINKASSMNRSRSTSMRMHTASTKSISSHSLYYSYPASSSKSNQSQTYSLIEFTYQSAESYSFELKYSDEDLSIISSNDREEEYKGSKTRDVNNDLFKLELPSIRTPYLVIDEMPAIHSNALVQRPKMKKQRHTTLLQQLL